jgi:hypothetical protein
MGRGHMQFQQKKRRRKKATAHSGMQGLERWKKQ